MERLFQGTYDGNRAKCRPAAFRCTYAHTCHCLVGSPVFISEIVEVGPAATGQQFAVSRQRVTDVKSGMSQSAKCLKPEVLKDCISKGVKRERAIHAVTAGRCEIEYKTGTHSEFEESPCDRARETAGS